MHVPGCGALASRCGLAVGGAALAFAAAALDTSHGNAHPDAEPSTVWDAVWTGGAHSSGMLEVVGSGGFALAIVGICLLLCRTFAVWIVLPLRAVGSMPLTAYTGQILVWARSRPRCSATPDDLLGFRDLEPFRPSRSGRSPRAPRGHSSSDAVPLEWAHRPRSRASWCPAGEAGGDGRADRLDR